MPLIPVILAAGLSGPNVLLPHRTTRPLPALLRQLHRPPTRCLAAIGSGSSSLPALPRYATFTPNRAGDSCVKLPSGAPALVEGHQVFFYPPPAPL